MTLDNSIEVKRTRFLFLQVEEQLSTYHTLSSFRMKVSLIQVLLLQNNIQKFYLLVYSIAFGSFLMIFLEGFNLFHTWIMFTLATSNDETLKCDVNVFAVIEHT